MRTLPRALAAALLLTAGCASIQAGRARTAYQREQLDAYRYRKPVEEVWQEARKMLAERGYGLAGKDAEAVGQKENFFRALISPARETRSDGKGGRFLETGWSGGTDRSRFRVEAIADVVGYRVSFTRIDEDPSRTGGAVRERDVEAEMDLLRRIDPDVAERIEEGMDAVAAGKPPPPPPAAEAAAASAAAAAAASAAGAAASEAAPGPAAPASAPLDEAGVTGQIGAIAEALRAAVGKRDVAAILAQVGDAGVTCSDGQRRPKEDVAAALGTAGAYANAYLFDGRAFRERYRSASRPWSLAEVLSDPGGTAVAVEFPGGKDEKGLSAPCAVYRVVNGGERATVCFERAGDRWVLDGGLMGCR
jgi:hypothetical protein